LQPMDAFCVASVGYGSPHKAGLRYDVGSFITTRQARRTLHKAAASALVLSLRVGASIAAPASNMTHGDLGKLPSRSDLVGTWIKVATR